jgi:hypothetical protein
MSGSAARTAITRLRIERWIEPALDLQRLEPLGSERPRPFDRGVDAEDPDRDARGKRRSVPAEDPPDRKARVLPQEVEQRHLDRGTRGRATVRRILGERRLHLRDAGVAAQRILADEQGLEEPEDGLGVVGRLSRHARIGRGDAEAGRAPRPARSARRCSSPRRRSRRRSCTAPRGGNGATTPRASRCASDGLVSPPIR